MEGGGRFGSRMGRLLSSRVLLLWLGVVEGVLDRDVVAGGERAEAFYALNGTEGGLIECL